MAYTKHLLKTLLRITTLFIYCLLNTFQISLFRSQITHNFSLSLVYHLEATNFPLYHVRKFISRLKGSTINVTFHCANRELVSGLLPEAADWNLSPLSLSLSLPAPFSFTPKMIVLYTNVVVPQLFAQENRWSRQEIISSLSGKKGRCRYYGEGLGLVE